MNELQKIMNNKYLYIPLIVWLCIQVYKVIHDLIKTKKFNFKRIVGAGGMPSSHSAVVTSLAAMIGKSEGFDTPIFAISVIFALIVMYDACGVRRAAGKQAAILNKILETPEMTKIEVQGKLVELLGHTPIQVFVGAVLGFVVGYIF